MNPTRRTHPSALSPVKVSIRSVGMDMVWPEMSTLIFFFWSSRYRILSNVTQRYQLPLLALAAAFVGLRVGVALSGWKREAEGSESEWKVIQTKEAEGMRVRVCRWRTAHLFFLRIGFLSIIFQLGFNAFSVNYGTLAREPSMRKKT